MSRTVSTTVEPLPFKQPLRIAGRVFVGIPGLRVTIAEDGVEGRGEAGGVFFLGDDTDHMLAEIARVCGAIADGADRMALRELLPPGGARNALDAALWELEARRTGRPVWQLAGLAPPRPLVTSFTLGADDPAVLQAALAGHADACALKLKLDGDLDADIARIRLVHAARPDAWLMVDANQGYTPDRLAAVLPVLMEARVRLLEQPFARGSEDGLDGMKLPLPVAADESLLSLDELPTLVGRFQVANIKLDKCGGLTEALMMVEAARRFGLGVMVGNMGGSSLAAAPAFLLGQICDHVDLDGPKFLAEDFPEGASYENGRIVVPDAMWGATSQPAADGSSGSSPSIAMTAGVLHGEAGIGGIPARDG